MSLMSQLAHAFASKRTVAIADCVHFCAYRYGRDEINPYEQYAKGLAEGLPLHVVRERFVDYLRGYRPRQLGEALGIHLSKPYPLWYLPWRTPEQVRGQPGWCGNAASIVDVMTYFFEGGIPRSAVEKEFGWHENAFATIQTHGYQPQRHSYILARELQGDRSAYIVTDGNHRLSAISALRARTVVIELPLLTTIVRSKVDKWPLVKAGIMVRDDALAVFDAYLHGNLSPYRVDQPMDVID